MFCNLRKKCFRTETNEHERIIDWEGELLKDDEENAPSSQCRANCPFLKSDEERKDKRFKKKR